MELLLILFLILLLFGTNRLPKIGESLGKMVGGFKKEIKEGKSGGEKEKKIN